MEKFYDVSAEKAKEALGARDGGLSSAEAEKRLAENGLNELAEGKKRSWFLRFLDQFKDVMIIVLVVAALVSVVLALVQKEYSELIDGGLIFLIVIVNAIIGLAQESKAENALEALKNMNKPFSKVLRDGNVVKIKSSDIVVGDIVVLEAGDMVPADMRLIETASLKIEEAALTGESVPSEKDADAVCDAEAPLGDRKNMAYSSGVTAYGRGKGVVTATGMNTEVGKIAKMLSDGKTEPTPLQKQLSKTAKFLSIIVLAIAAVIFIVLAVREGTEGMIEAFMTAVAIAVAAIPEGLPAVVTIVLAIGVQRMSEKNAIVRNLPAVETLGACQIICSDKTGTLTLNKMTVKQLYTKEDGMFLTEDGQKPGKAYEYLVSGMVLCNDTVQADDGKLLGDPTETALVAYAAAVGFDAKKINLDGERVNELPFDSVRKLMTTVNKYDGAEYAFVKGAPDMLIAKCEHMQESGQVVPITEAHKEEIKKANSEMAEKALRVLAVAIKKDNLSEMDSLESELIFVGLVGMIDPPRPEVKAAVQTCYDAGMVAIMITGDHQETAAAIARDIGILSSEEQLIITGAELDKLSDAEFEKDLGRYRVFARVSPENKVRIVKAFKAYNGGKIVAMTGDGVNDAPSLKIADIGIGMGITGTDVSKGASDMVLADDNFATIVTAVEEGRKVYSNIKKAVQFLLSANIAEVLCLFIATVFLRVPFLTPVMILWVNLVTDSLPALALGMEKAEKDIMLQPPREGSASLFHGRTGTDIVIQGIMQTGLVMAAFCISYYAGDAAHASSMTMAFVTLCLIQLFHSFNMRSQTHSVINKGFFSNKYLNLSFLVGLVLILFTVLVPFMNNAFETVWLTGSEWGICIGLAVAVIPLVELQKAIERGIAKRRTAKVKS